MKYKLNSKSAILGNHIADKGKKISKLSLNTPTNNEFIPSQGSILTLNNNK